MRICCFCIFAVIAIASAKIFAADEAGFEPIFDGKTFTGWKTWDADYWSIKDGAIIGTITKERPLKENRYLIWKGNEKAPDGELADFELKLKSRVRGEGAINNGFQFRSKLLKNRWDIAGYQVDNNLNVGGGSPWLVRLYDEHGRDTLALRGERTTFDENGKATREPIKEAAGEPWFKLEEWHEYHLICIGHRLTLKVDDRLAAEVIDNDPKQFDAQGILGLQLHSGPPTEVQFKDIRVKIIKSAKP